MGLDKNNQRQVVVTGLGIVSPLESGEGVDAFWKAVLAGRNTVAPAGIIDTAPYATHAVAQIRGRFDTAIGKDHLYERRWQAFIEHAFAEAVADSGVTLKAGDGQKAGIVLGTVLGGVAAGEKLWRSEGSNLSEGYRLSSGAEQLAKDYSIKGPVLTISNACASGTDAIGIAARYIAAGRADVMIAGGGDALSEFAFSGFSSLGALTKDLVRPFDKDRSGLALGEGAAFLALESKASAKARGARIYAEVAGYSSAADANHMTGPDREGRGLASAIGKALKKAGLARVDYISAHGTGTPYNDQMETLAIKRAFPDSAFDIPVSSIKSMIGHSFGAAGAIEAVTCIKAMETASVPPTVNLETDDPACDLDYVKGLAREVKVDSALSLSAGFGGQNAALVFTRAE